MQKMKRINPVLQAAAMLPTAVFSVGLTASAAYAAIAQPDEVIVTARRQEESVQDVPISITVLDQESLSNNNVFSSADLKQFTPSLAVNQRFGPDQASFAIRGFTQELRTTASVGFYFAEVVAPRGGGSVTSGDGAGPGAFFDLQNVLVLKGPQGTLFGRNTTGGAIMLTPQEPTQKLEGYLESSVGSYDMQRMQGVINVPMGDRVRTRFGVDTMQRDGYLENKSGVGPGELGNTDYFAARASMMVDVADSVQNYTILSYTNSENNGVVSGLFACDSANRRALYSAGCAAQLAHQGNDFYALEQRMEDPVSKLKQWQLINTTTWDVNDDLTIKNILSYADLNQTTRTTIYGINYDSRYGDGTYGFVVSDAPPGIPTNSQTSFVEELQFQGYALDGDLRWQAGLYFENSKPDGASATQSINNVYCSSLDQSNPAASTCVDVVRANFNELIQLNGLPASYDPFLGQLYGPTGFGSISRQLGEIEYMTQAVYSEMTYDINNDWKVTGGLRYTRDEVKGEDDSTVWGSYPWQWSGTTPNLTPPTPSVAGSVLCMYPTEADASCKSRLDQASEAVTGLIDFDYFLTADVMLYAKYSRGYRMGSLNIFGAPEFRKYDPEQVDAYELGAKTSFGGVVPGTFNVAAFYNDLQNQQLQYGYLGANIPPTTAVQNAGSSVIQGVEVETSLRLLEDLTLNISYSYLDTELKEVEEIPGVPGEYRIIATATAGSDLTFSPMHSATANLNYRLPLPADIGGVSLGVSYSYTGEQNSSSPKSSPYARLSSYEVVNLNANWMGIYGSNFDASLFVTNALDEKYTTYVPALYNSMGMETRTVGMPKMWGAKLRYNFGH